MLSSAYALLSPHTCAYCICTPHRKDGAFAHLHGPAGQMRARGAERSVHRMLCIFKWKLSDA